MTHIKETIANAMPISKGKAMDLVKEAYLQGELLGKEKIKSKLKKSGFVSAVKVKKLTDASYDKGHTDGRKWIDTTLRNQGAFSGNRQYEFEWGSLGVFSGFITEPNFTSADRVKVRESLEIINPDLPITVKEVGYWREQGWFNSTEAYAFNSREQNESELAMAQDAAYATTFTDPHFKALLMNITNYMIGGGLRYSVPNLKVQQYLDDFWYRNKLGLLQSQIVFNTLMMGEYFMGLFIEPPNSNFSGETSIRKYRTYEISGVEVGATDRDCLLSYEYIASTNQLGKYSTDYIADYNYFKQYDAGRVNKQISANHNLLDRYKLMMFLRYNFGDEVRGRVPFAGALKYLRMGRDFLFDRFLLNHERGRILWIEKVARSNTTRNTMYKPTPYSDVLDLPFGKILRVSEGNEINVMKANIDGADALPDYLNILYMAAAEAQVPLIIIDQRASEEVYASMKRSANPFHQMIEALRTFFGYYFGEMFRFVIEQGVISGKLPSTTQIKIYEPYSSEKKPATAEIRVDTNNVPIEIIWPEVFTEDPLSQARADALMLDRMVLSPETVANRQGLNYAEETVKIQQFQDSGIMPKVDKDKDKGNGKVARVGLSEYELSVVDGIALINERLDILEKQKKNK